MNHYGRGHANTDGKKQPEVSSTRNTSTSWEDYYFTSDSTDENHKHSPLMQVPCKSINRRSLNYDDDNKPPAKKFKSEEAPSGHQIAVIVPIMASRLQQTIGTYKCWSKKGFDIVLVFNKDEKEAITKIIHSYAPDMVTTFVLHAYTTSIPPNAGIAKSKAYSILQWYLDHSNYHFALLLDDTVDDIFDTSTEKSIMTNPTNFCISVKEFAEESPVFGGTVAYKRHRDKCQQGGIARVKRAFLQQALVFSCRGTSTLTKHYENIDDYIDTMRELSYRRVPFGEDVSFQVALYEKRVLSHKKSPQFWGLGVSRIDHVSATKPSFDQLNHETKEALKEMMIYLQKQRTLRFNSNKELVELRVLPGCHICIPIIGKNGERPWREAHEYAFSSSK